MTYLLVDLLDLLGESVVVEAAIEAAEQLPVPNEQEGGDKWEQED